MSEVMHSRRDALRGAAIGAGAIAAGSVLRPALAAAQTPEDEDLRDFLVWGTSLEQLAVLAYATVARDGDPALRSTMETFRDQEQAHASALRGALDSLGFDLPPAPNSTTDVAAFEGVEGLDEATSEELVKLLEELDRLSSPKQYLDYLLALEAKQIRFYTGQGPTVDSVDLTTTSAEIAGCQAQHIVALEGTIGERSDRAAAEAARIAAEAVPAAS